MAEIAWAVAHTQLCGTTTTKTATLRRTPGSGKLYKLHPLEKHRLIRLRRSTKDGLGLRVHRFACGCLAVHSTETGDLELLARLLHGVNPPLQSAARPPPPALSPH